MTVGLLDVLVEAWERWDLKPTFEREAFECERAVQEFADAHGLNATELRARISAGRRAGLSVRDAVRSNLVHTDPA